MHFKGPSRASLTTAGLSVVAGEFTVVAVMVGLKMYSCIAVMSDGWNYVPSVAPRGAPFNP